MTRRVVEEIVVGTEEASHDQIVLGFDRPVLLIRCGLTTSAQGCGSTPRDSIAADTVADLTNRRICDILRAN
jgi:hypothetical protein